MKVTVIGTGYVGLVSGICLAKTGHQIICVDKDQNKLDKLQKNIIPIYEPGLTELLQEVVKKQQISFTSNLQEAIADSNVVLIAVGTPQDEDGSADLSYVYAAAKEIATYAKNYCVIVTKSTVPVGTSQAIKKIIQQINPTLDFDVASNPEFLREGAAISDFMQPDRIVIGVENDRAKKTLLELYGYFNPSLVVTTDITTSELIKYSSNAFLATKIAFINEMSDLCEKVGGNIKDLSKAVGLDTRIGSKFLNPGPGFGGSCFPKDINAILNSADKHDVDLSLVRSVITSNAKRKITMAQKIADALNGNLSGKKIAFLGLAFKAQTDDIRYSPAIVIAQELLNKGATLIAHDPQAIANAKVELANFKHIEFVLDVYDSFKDVDAIVVATEWQEYNQLNFARIATLVRGKKIIDLRNIIDVAEAKKHQFSYGAIGLADSK